MRRPRPDPDARNSTLEEVGGRVTIHEHYCRGWRVFGHGTIVRLTPTRIIVRRDNGLIRAYSRKGGLGLGAPYGTAIPAGRGICVVDTPADEPRVATLSRGCQEAAERYGGEVLGFLKAATEGAAVVMVGRPGEITVWWVDVQRTPPVVIDGDSFPFSADDQEDRKKAEKAAKARMIRWAK